MGHAVVVDEKTKEEEGGRGSIGREPGPVDGEKLLARLDGAEITARRSAECAVAPPLPRHLCVYHAKIGVPLHMHIYTRTRQLYCSTLSMVRHRVCYNFDNNARQRDLDYTEFRMWPIFVVKSALKRFVTLDQVDWKVVLVVRCSV